MNVHRATSVDGLTSGESAVRTQKLSVKSHFRTGGEFGMESDSTAPLNLTVGVTRGSAPTRKGQRSGCGQRANEWVSPSGGREERRLPSIDTAVDVARNSKGVNRTGGNATFERIPIYSGSIGEDFG